MRISNQEAIEIIKLAQAQIEWDYPMDYAAAFDMAISALRAQNVPDTNISDTISRQAAIDGVKTLHELAWKNWHEPTLSANVVIDMIKDLPSAKSEYEPVKAEDFAKTMSENTLYGFIAWYSEALELMKRQGFVICKKTL